MSVDLRLALALLVLPCSALAAIQSPLPLGSVSAAVVPGNMIELTPNFPLKPGDTLSGACQVLIPDGDLGPDIYGSGTPVRVPLPPGQPHTCYLEVNSPTDGYYWGLALPAAVMVPDPAHPGPEPQMPVRNLTATATKNSITLHFDPPAPIGGDVAGYVAGCFIERPGYSATLETVAMAPASPITVTRLRAGSPYRCLVVAYNGAGLSPNNTPVALLSTLGTPAQPVPALGAWGAVLLSVLLAAVMAAYGRPATTHSAGPPAKLRTRR